MRPELLTREKFREAVFERDGRKCVFCPNPAKDAHHILERRLWPDSGYYLANGASVCEEHHIKCEQTLIPLDEVRKACGIKKVILPPHFYDDQDYDKWGNPIMPSGQRLMGELFQDESVQKVLERGGVLNSFTHHVKYPRTFHLPWSEGMNDDDRMMDSTESFVGKRVIAAEKMDGENTTLYQDYIHARSLDGNSHISRDWVKQFWSTIRMDIPENWRVCGENLYAKHSIGYDSLPTYFMGFSIWLPDNTCLSWDETQEYFELLGITSVPVLYDGIYDEKAIKALWDNKSWGTQEGYVLRVADAFHAREFKTKIGKFVRAKHVQTAKHWMFGQRMEKNTLK